MKNILVTFVCLTLLVVSTGFGQEDAKTIVTVGGSYWNATYTYQDEDGKDLYKFGTGNLFGPYLSLSHGKWNFGTSMYFGTFPVDKITAGDLNVTRSDLNFTLGYRVHPNINVFAGVKYLSWTLEGTYDYYDSYYDLTSISYKATEKGPMFGAGIAGTVPLGSSGLYGFGSLAYLVGTMTTESKDESSSLTHGTSIDTPSKLVALNLGLGYRFPSGLGVNIGYRADLYTESTDVENALGKSVTVDNNLGVKGLVATVSYTFR
jgi:hypothetical protein